MTHAPVDPQDVVDRDCLLGIAALQDSLLQSYRSLHATIQSILLAIGVGLAVVPLTQSPYPQASPAVFASGALLLGAFLLHWYSSSRLKRVVLARGQDVSYCHRAIIVVEQRMPLASRHFTRFKAHQLAGRGELADRALTEAEILNLVPTGLGHTRRVVDVHLFQFMSAVWILLVVVTWAPLLCALVEASP